MYAFPWGILKFDIKYMKLLILFVFFSLFFSGCSNSLTPPNDTQSIRKAEAYSLSQLKKSLNSIQLYNYPIRTNGVGDWEATAPSGWTSGFFPGCLWYAYKLSNDSFWIESAKNFTEGLNGQQFNTSDHDIGFRIFCSYGNGYKVLGNEDYKIVGLQAANSLATRYNPNVGCIQSWNGKFQVIMDNMMNLELLFWASRNGGSQQLYNIAVSHAYKTLSNQIRADGSSYQLVVYDSLSGKLIERKTVQGYSDSSTWSRGQAWGIYGFTMCYRETNDIIFLNTARKMADYFIDHLPSDYVPYWDLNLPDSDNRKFKDASAASIASSGLFELSRYGNYSSKYYNSAVKILNSLIDNYLSINTGSSGILLHCAYNVNSINPFDWDASTIWGDYYFLEALSRYLNLADNLD